MELIYATTNSAKLNSMKDNIKGLEIELIGLSDVNIKLPFIDENGRDPLENAVIKAKNYYSAIKRPLFSCDSGLYIDELPDSLQPGVHVRRVNGRELDDDEVVEYYSGLAKSLGGKMTARYRNGICLIFSEDKIFTHTGSDISYESFILTDKPHSRRVKGFPLDCLSVRADSGRYYYDMPKSDELTQKSNSGFYNFFKNAIGKANLY